MLPPLIGIFNTETALRTVHDSDRQYFILQLLGLTVKVRSVPRGYYIRCEIGNKQFSSIGKRSVSVVEIPRNDEMELHVLEQSWTPAQVSSELNV